MLLPLWKSYVLCVLLAILDHVNSPGGRLVQDVLPSWSVLSWLCRTTAGAEVETEATFRNKGGCQ